MPFREGVEREVTSLSERYEGNNLPPESIQGVPQLRYALEICRYVDRETVL